MAVRFRYRSSAAFNSVDLGGALAISVRQLRDRILGPHLRRDFDLLISDAAIDQPFDDDEAMIPAGSDVVVKRVPIGGSAPREMVVGMRGGGDLVEGVVSLPASQNVDPDNFDDFGNELCPGLEASLPESDADGVELDSTFNIRCSGMPTSRYQNVEGSDLSEAMSKETVGENCNIDYAAEEDKKETKMNTITEEPKKIDEGAAKCSQVMLNMDLPTELRCFLCKTIFKDAVMIPCCQHSFCDKCIRFALVELKRCPKCSSTKCTIEDLLPNLSLRQAIEHFLETQHAIGGFDNLIPKYAPDVESGIQAKEVSYAPSILQHDRQLPCSPSATGKGSNQVMPDSPHNTKKNAGIKIRLDGDKSVKTALAANQNVPEDTVKKMVSLQGSGISSKVHQKLPPKENVNLPILETKTLGMNTQDGSVAVVPPVRQRKSDRTCYMCGSPNHLIRDCPLASNVYSAGDNAFQGAAYGPANWHGPLFHPLQHYGNMYGNPGIIPFDPGVVPVSPFAMPSYVPSLYGGMTAPYPFMRMGGGMPSPTLTGAERPLVHAEFMDVRGTVKKHKVQSGKGIREYDYDERPEDYQKDDAPRILHKERYQSDKGISESYSDEGSRRVYKRHQKDKFHSPTHDMSGSSSAGELHYSVDKDRVKEFHASGRDRRYNCSDKSSSEVHDASDSSNNHSRQRNTRHHRSSRKKEESRGKRENDSSRKSRHQSQKERADDMDISMKRKHIHKNLHHFKCRLETDRSTDYRHDYKDEESSQSHRHFKLKVSSSEGLLENDRWEMVDGPDDDDRRGYYRHKRKRIH